MASNDRGYCRMAILDVVVAAAWLILSGRLSAQGGWTGVPGGRRTEASAHAVQAHIP
jgi:hypothetical protein